MLCFIFVLFCLGQTIRNNAAIQIFKQISSMDMQLILSKHLELEWLGYMTMCAQLLDKLPNHFPKMCHFYIPQVVFVCYSFSTHYELIWSIFCFLIILPVCVHDLMLSNAHYTKGCGTHFHLLIFPSLPFFVKICIQNFFIHYWNLCFLINEFEFLIYSEYK